MRKRWYGAPILGLELTGAVAIVAGAFARDVPGAIALPGTLLYLVSGPAVHLSEGEGGYAALSFAGNFVDAALTYRAMSRSCTPKFRCEPRWDSALSALAWFAIAPALDAWLLSTKTEAIDVAMRPVVTADRTGGFVGVSGSF